MVFWVPADIFVIIQELILLLGYFGGSIVLNCAACITIVGCIPMLCCIDPFLLAGGVPLLIEYSCLTSAALADLASAPANLTEGLPCLTNLIDLAEIPLGITEGYL
jgi:hypothetical protein